MTKNENILLRISYPKWFVFFMSTCWTIILLFSLFYTFKIIFDGLSISISFCVVLLFCIIGGVWFSKFLFFYAIATEVGLKTGNTLFEINESCIWDEIIEVQRPRFGIPYEYSYVVLSNKKKLLLLRSMQNYKELIELIKTRAPNLQECIS